MIRTPKKLAQTSLGDYIVNAMGAEERANTTTSDHLTYTVTNTVRLPILDLAHLTIYVDSTLYTLTANDSVNLTTGAVTFETAYTTETVQLNYSWVESTITTLVTSPAATRTQITQIWVTNTNGSTTRDIKLYAHGTNSTNVLMAKIAVTAEETVRVDDMKVVLAAGETMSAIQNSNTEDVIVTVYGVEEV